ncbi:MAG: sodium:proton antiporter [Cyclobacteriaceae bacterium]|nr:MAG: sodium:proton antiporter [Cyclobacteriaceae bacterium]
MATIIILIFVIGYLSITLEHPLKLDKTVPALIMASLMWAVLAIAFHGGLVTVIDTHDHIFDASAGYTEEVEEGFIGALLHHLGKTAEILVFLIGAMTIVEIIDLHKGFQILKDYVNTRNKRKLLWIIGILAFILSAIIDNLTATIVLITLLRKLIPNKQARLWYAAMIVIAANAGGAWSPIGDVTTTMLWIGKKVSTGGLISKLVIPSIVCMVVPTLIVSYLSPFRGEIEVDPSEEQDNTRLLSSKKMLYLGLGAIVSVPVFKTLTHLPPYLGMMLALGVVWLVSEYITPEPNFTEEKREHYRTHHALAKIEMSSILFFLGILMAVGALESLVIAGSGVGALRYVAEGLDAAIPNQDVVIMMLGVASAIIDNVPLVAASMGMYNFPLDDYLWHFIAYAAGTGGSMLIIGSAAGVAAMGMERIDFIWYLRKVTWLAAIGFVAGSIVYILLNQ